MKFLLDIEPSLKPKKDDLIIYDSYKKMFVVVSKNSFLNDVNDKTNELQEIVRNQEKEIEQLKGQISLIAKAVGDMI